ncbi:hypothetical protein Acsp06_20320 [Actinomycetospora sp. NBRC 106375]|uniref:hypothetical protein n=1 Tax=Actinomycetospora sp. NBRC 106375 TaxID=3032207 RepID=UPI0024A07B57|nr:hypothetical protein [Actinomycetospora sp. NBRC 106375]GLZ45847.1 hypothetical protein Acsp06_20320 [Actinomycetospora sp. NBRC 106375]
MVKPARSRRSKERTVAGRHHEDVDAVVRRTLGRRALREEHPDGELTVQLLPHHLAAGALTLAVGDETEVAPAIYAGGHLPALSDRQAWTVDEFGCFDGRGEVITAPVSAQECSCHVDVFDVAGRLFPLNWAASEPVDGRLWIEGALYLEPELAVGTEHGEAVALCRRRYRVREMRRYRRTTYRPVDPVRLETVPAPDRVTDEAIYVADLRLLDATVPEA